MVHSDVEMDGYTSCTCGPTKTTMPQRFLSKQSTCMVTASHVCSDGSRHFTVEGNFGTANSHVPFCGGLLRELSCKLLEKALGSARKVTLRNFVLSRYEDKVVLHFQTDGYALLCAGDLADGAVVQIPYCGGVCGWHLMAPCVPFHVQWNPTSPWMGFCGNRYLWRRPPARFYTRCP